MIHIYGESFSKNIKFENFKQFIRARFARIYPLHIFSFLSMAIFFLLYSRTNTLSRNYSFNLIEAIPANLSLLHSMGIQGYLNWNIPSWAISTEWWMYVLFPFVLTPFNKITGWKKIFIPIFIIAGYLIIIYYLHPLSNAISAFPKENNVNSLDVTYDFGFIRCFFGFMSGVFIYKLYQIKWMHSYFKSSFLLLFASAMLIVVLSFRLSDLIPVILFASIVLMGAYNNGLGKKLLNLRPLLFLGDISYSLYMMHFPIMAFFLTFIGKYTSMPSNANLASSWMYCFVYLAITIMVSTFTYGFIENPIRKKLNQF